MGDPSAGQSPSGPSPGLEECLKLLKAPADESRFVGLLLATKVLPAGDEASLLAIIDAVGFTFLERLLLPLKKQPLQSPELSPDQTSQAAASCSLALAVLSSCCRSTQVAASDELSSLFPVFLKVVTAGGLEAALSCSAASQRAPQEPGGAAADGTLQDALECMVAAARASEEARRELRGLGGFFTCSRLLRACAVGARGGGGGGGGREEEEGEKQRSSSSSSRAALLGMALLQALLLEGEEVETSIKGFDEHAEDLGAAVEALAELLSLVAAAAATPEQQKQQKGEKDAGGRNGAASLAAAVHLEALHTLLLLFPRGPGRLREQLLLLAGQGEEAEGPALSEGHPGAAAAWPGLVRRGLHALVVGRAPMVQRHAGLRLAAAVAELLGPAWLAGEGLTGSATGAFFQAVVEVVKVEVAVLMHDALEPPRSVPSTTERTSAASEYVPVQAEASQKAHDQGHEEDCEDEGDASEDEEGIDYSGGGGGTAWQRPPKVNDGGSGEMQQPRGEGRGGPGQEEAVSDSESRARDLLPSCFSLIEASLGVLVLCVEGEAADVSDAVASRAMSSISDAMEVVVQYLEERSGAAAGTRSSEEEAEALRDPMALAATRLLCSFAMEAPSAHEGRIATLLPFMLKVHGGIPGPAEGARFAVMLLSAQAQAQAAGGHCGDGSEGGSERNPELSFFSALLLSNEAVAALCAFVHCAVSELSLLQAATTPLTEVDVDAQSVGRRQELEESLADASEVILEVLERLQDTDDTMAAGLGHLNISSDAVSSSSRAHQRPISAKDAMHCSIQIIKQPGSKCVCAYQHSGN